MREKKILAAIFLLALVLRIGGNAVKERIVLHKEFLLFGDKYRQSMRVSDMRWYDGTARAFLAGKGVVSMDRYIIKWNHRDLKTLLQHKALDTTYYAHTAIPPLYPIFLGICYFLGGFNTLSYLIPQAILGSLTCVFIYLIGKEIFDKKTALTAGIAVALYPDLVFWVNVVSPHTLFIFLLTLGFLLLIKGNNRGNRDTVYVGAVVMGLACLARITLILFMPVFFIWESTCFSRSRILNLRVAVFTVLIMALVLFPWCMRNYVVFREFTPFTSETIVVLWSTNKQDPNVEADRYIRSYKSKVLRTAVFIKENYKEYAAISLKRFIKFWSPYTAPMQKFAKAYRLLTWLIVFPLAFYGMACSLKYWHKTIFIIAFIVYHSLLHAASFVDDGLVYRYPIQPFLCIFAAYGFWTIYGKKKIRQPND